MHAFLVCCALIEGIGLAVIGYFLRQSWRGGAANSERIDAIIRDCRMFSDYFDRIGITPALWRETIEVMGRHGLGLRELDERLRHSEGTLTACLADLRSLMDRANTEEAEFDSRLEQFESSLRALVASVGELSELRADDTRDLGKRLTDAFDEIERLRRKAGAQTGGAFDVQRNRAERISAKPHEISRTELMALAEGK